MLARLPWWAAFLPLVVGLIVWHGFWRGHGERLRQSVAEVAPADARLSLSGFPYRLALAVEPPAGRRLQLAREGEGWRLAAHARRLTVHAQPRRDSRRIYNLDGAGAEMALTGLAQATARLEAPRAQLSLRVADGRLQRLSWVGEEAVLALGFLARPWQAGQLEFHLREVDAQPGSGPRYPQRVQGRLVARGMALGGRNDAELELTLGVTAPAALRSASAWLAGGTLEAETWRLSLGGAVLAEGSATIVPAREGLVLAGTARTFCPETVMALARGEAAPREYRTRAPLTLAFQGRPPSIGVVAPPLPPEAARRRLEPPCLG